MQARSEKARQCIFDKLRSSTSKDTTVVLSCKPLTKSWVERPATTVYSLLRRLGKDGGKPQVVTRWPMGFCESLVVSRHS